jgi:hypothetical protein
MTGNLAVGLVVAVASSQCRSRSSSPFVVYAATARENPYRLADNVQGIGFLTADSLRRMLGIAPASPFPLRVLSTSARCWRTVGARPLERQSRTCGLCSTLDRYSVRFVHAPYRCTGTQQ